MTFDDLRLELRVLHFLLEARKHVFEQKFSAIPPHSMEMSGQKSRVDRKAEWTMKYLISALTRLRIVLLMFNLMDLHQGHLVHVCTIKKRDEEHRKRKKQEVEKKGKNKGDQAQGIVGQPMDCIKDKAQATQNLTFEMAQSAKGIAHNKISGAAHTTKDKMSRAAKATKDKVA
ncbi:hypothetical protein H5410_046740 [Solanum commersonii]|uniref:Uncharacterized protein n=1 Tax=Solanum commersonii TaxID=4109 RepID=A0A9J5XF65_SOLCO|nr:hypothetical protein H5410_046740 [Solanum commersonii]